MRVLLKNDFLNEHFFVISSENCSSFDNSFYGFVIKDHSIGINESVLNETELFEQSEYGCYIQIVRNNDKINIFQDFHGSYGLYLYNNKSYWAISNSFLLLVDYLIDKQIITLNTNYVNAWCVTPLSTWSYSETPINEISSLNKNDYIIIDTTTKQFQIKQRKLDSKIPLISRGGYSYLINGIINGNK